MPRLTLPEFIARWQASTRNERAAAQEHFIDLCDVLGQKRPAELDPTGDFYTFEKGATKIGGGDGFADVWKRGHFAWEYKGKRKNLNAAYQQLLQYREDLGEPAPAGRLRPRPLRGPYQLHRHRQAGLRLHPRRPCKPDRHADCRTARRSTCCAPSSPTPTVCGRPRTTAQVTEAGSSRVRQPGRESPQARRRP